MGDKIKVEIKSGKHALSAEATGQATRYFYTLAVIAMLVWLILKLW